MGFREYLLHPFPARTLRPLARRKRTRILTVQIQRDRRKSLKQAYEEVRHFVVSELLSKTDSRAGVEGNEHERVCMDAFGTLVEEAIGIKIVR